MLFRRRKESRKLRDRARVKSNFTKRLSIEQFCRGGISKVAKRGAGITDAN